MFPIAGATVTQVRVDFAFGLQLATDRFPQLSVDVRIQSLFECHCGGVVTRIDPEEQTVDLGPLVTLHQAVVQEAYATDDCLLVLRFNEDRAIFVELDEHYEAWTVDGRLPATNDQAFLVVAWPGGELAIFD